MHSLHIKNGKCSYWGVNYFNFCITISILFIIIIINMGIWNTFYESKEKKTKEEKVILGNFTHERSLVKKN